MAHCDLMASVQTDKSRVKMHGWRVTAAGGQGPGECTKAPAARVSGLVGLGSREIISFISAAKTNLGADSGDQTASCLHHPPQLLPFEFIHQNNRYYN